MRFNRLVELFDTPSGQRHLARIESECLADEDAERVRHQAELPAARSRLSAAKREAQQAVEAARTQRDRAEVAYHAAVDALQQAENAYMVAGHSDELSASTSETWLRAHPPALVRTLLEEIDLVLRKWIESRNPVQLVSWRDLGARVHTVSNWPQVQEMLESLRALRDTVAELAFRPLSAADLQREIARCRAAIPPKPAPPAPPAAPTAA